jgi:transposase
VAKAQAELEGLNEHKQGKKRYADGVVLRACAQAILKQHHVDGLLQVRIEEQVEERAVRAYGDRPASMRVERTLSLHTTVDEPEVAAAVRRLGWRVYVTNQPKELLSLEQVVLAYREEYLVEHGFGRVIGKPLSLSPMPVQSDQRATGLVRLLSIGLHVLTLLEFQVRQRLADQQETLAGLYAGNPKRTTQRPTAEALLGAFQGIHLSLVTLGQQLHRHLTPLSALQQRILALLDFSSDLYDQLLC